MKRLFYLIALLAGTSAFMACNETSEDVGEFDNWKARNETFFKDTLALAKSEVAAAKASWGDAWEDHCDWRVFGSYCNAEGSKTTWEDSIAVRVIERGTGAGSPLFTDSVRVVYAGRLMPSDNYAMGYMFDHTGLSTKLQEVMNPHYEVAATFCVSGLVEGFTTALQHMHVGDYWRTYMPSNMGYGASTSTSKIPAYSTLVFDMRLKGYSRVGVSPNK